LSGVANAAPIELSNLDGGRSFPEVHLIESQVLLLPNHGLIPSTVDTKYHRAQKFCLRNSTSVFYTLGVQIPYGCRQGICGAFAMSSQAWIPRILAYTPEKSAGMPGINLGKLS
jgi:hypothetical protein